MTDSRRPGSLTRRNFFRSVAQYGSAAAVAAAFGRAAPLGAQRYFAPFAPRDQIGLQLFTVRDLTSGDYPGTLKKVAEIGYREVQTTGSYGQHTPAQIRSYLDAAGLTAPTTHVNPPMGDDFERTLEGYREIGHRYTTVRFGGGGGRARPAAGAANPAGAAPRVPGAPRPPAPPQTLDSVRRTAEQLNEAGLITRRHGLKVILHNHTEEFQPLADSSQRPYDVILAETDPDLVAMELDIGWAAVAGEDAVELFQRNPGRYEVWHVKDIAGVDALEGLSIPERRRAARIVPLGEGDLDYRPIFAAAEVAGMKHFYVEQDTAPQSGDSLAEAAKSYHNLVRVLA